MDVIIKENEKLKKILNKCFTAINCPRGRHYPNKDYGSFVKEQGSEISLQEALDYARQSVKEIDGVLIESAKSCEEGIVFQVLINNEKGQVTIEL